MLLCASFGTPRRSNKSSSQYLAASRAFFLPACSETFLNLSAINAFSRRPAKDMLLRSTLPLVNLMRPLARSAADCAGTMPQGSVFKRSNQQVCFWFGTRFTCKPLHDVGQLGAVQLVRSPQLRQRDPASGRALDLVVCPFVPPRSQLADVKAALLCQIAPEGSSGPLLRRLVPDENLLNDLQHAALRMGVRVRKSFGSSSPAGILTGSNSASRQTAESNTKQSILTTVYCD